MQDFDYNTQREDIILKEYGRNVQNLTEHIKTVKDKEEQTKLAKTLVKLMKMINPSGQKDSEEVEQKTWDHLHIISNFELELENAPFETPEKEVLFNKPQRVAYGTSKIKLKHYGKNVEKIIEKIAAEPDPELQLSGISKVGKMMKKFYSDFNKDIIEDGVIASQIESISKGKVKVDLEKVEELKLFHISKAELFHSNNNPNHNGRKKKKHNNNNKHRNKNKRN